MKNRKGNRLKGYDYSRDNLYFITICVQDKLCCFGEIIAVAGAGTGRDLYVRNDDSNRNESNQIMVLN